MGIISNLLFGDNSDKTTYKDAAQAKAYRDITEKTLDRAYEGSKDYLDNNYEGGYNKYKSDLMYGLQDQATDKLNKYNAGKNEIFGNGLIGSLLNPIAQTASGLGDLALLGISGGKYNAWDGSNNYLGTHRDIGSDLGALGETAFTVLPIANNLKVAKAGKAVNAARTAGKVIEPGTKLAKQAALWEKSQIPKTIGQKVAGGALFGAGYGATGSLRDMGFENFDPQQFMLSTGIGAGVGGGLAGVGGLWNKYTAPTEKGIVPAGSAGANTGEYQNALNTLKEAGIDTTNPDLAQKSFRKWSVTNHPDKGGSEELFKKVSGANDLYQKLYKTAGKGGATTVYSAAPKQSFGQKLSNLKENVANTKAGTKVANLLKTKKGKVLAGAGGGLLLAQLLRNKGQNNNNLSDEELNELYNYVYGGGQ